MTTTNLARQSGILEMLFPPAAVAAYELRGSADPVFLLPEEAADCTTFHAKRLEEFAAGRICARAALGELGHAEFALRRNPDRTPRWPDGIVGSISHTVGFCGAVAASRERFAGVGIDAEIVSRVTPDVWSQALTVDDVSRISSLAPRQREHAAAVIFAAKEAFYKCQSRVTGAWLDYSDVSVELVQGPAGCGTFLVRSATTTGQRIIGDFVGQGCFRIVDALVFAGVALTPQEAALLPSRRLVFA